MDEGRKRQLRTMSREHEWSLRIQRSGAMSLESQMTHAAWDAALPYDIEEETRRNPFLAAHVAACDRKFGKDEHGKEEQEVEE